MKIYAQIGTDGIVNGISRLSGIVEAENMIEVLDYDDSLLGKKYVNGTFVDVPKPLPELVISVESRLAAIETKLNSILEKVTPKVI